MNHQNNIKRIEDKIEELGALKRLIKKAENLELKIFRHEGTLNRREVLQDQLDEMNEKIDNKMKTL